MRDSSSSKAETLQYWLMKLGQYALKCTVGKKIPQNTHYFIVPVNIEICETA